MQKLEETKKPKKPRENQKKTIKPKNNCQGVLVKHPNFLKSLEFMCFFVFFGFLEVFLFFWFSRGFFGFPHFSRFVHFAPGLFSHRFCICDGARVYQKWTKSQTPRHTKICLQFIFYISTTYFFMTFFPFVLLHAYGLDGARFFAKG